MSKTILVLDDDEDVRMIIEWHLKKAGFNAEFADDGEKAVKMFSDASANGSPYDAVIMDLNIPGKMGGRDAVRLVLEKDPSACVFVASGADDDPAVVEFDAHGFKGVLSKPFQYTEMVNLFSRLNLL